MKYSEPIQTKTEGDIHLDVNEGRFLYTILTEKLSSIRNQQPQLVKKKFELIKKIVLTDRTIQKGDQPAFFGLVTETVDKYIKKNNILYREMIEVEDVIQHNEYEMEVLYVVLINKIKTEFDFKFPVKIEYIPVEETSEYKHLRKYTLLMLDLSEDTQDSDINWILKKYSTFRFR